MATTYIVGAAKKNVAQGYVDFLRRNAVAGQRESSEVMHRDLGGSGTEDTVVTPTRKNIAYMCKITSYISGSMYNVDVYQHTTDATSLGVGIVTLADNQIGAAALAAGTWVVASPYNLIGTPVVGVV